MKNINIEALISEFVSNENIIRMIWMDNSNVIEYYFLKHINRTKTYEIIEDIIKDSFYEDLEWKTIEKIIDNLENYNSYEYIDWLVDIYEKDLINWYFYFDINTPIIEWDEIMTDVLMRAQYEGYNELFESIKKEFINYLQIKNI